MRTVEEINVTLEAERGALERAEERVKGAATKRTELVAARDVHLIEADGGSKKAAGALDANAEALVRIELEARDAAALVSKRRDRINALTVEVRLAAVRAEEDEARRLGAEVEAQRERVSAAVDALAPEQGRLADLTRSLDALVRKLGWGRAHDAEQTLAGLLVRSDCIDPRAFVWNAAVLREDPDARAERLRAEGAAAEAERARRDRAPAVVEAALRELDAREAALRGPGHRKGGAVTASKLAEVAAQRTRLVAIQTSARPGGARVVLEGVE